MAEDKKILTVDNHIATQGGRIPYVSPSGTLIVPFQVKGTHFPASPRPNRLPAWFRVVNNIEGEMLIDFSDGTGKHTYNFKNAQGELVLSMYRKSEAISDIWRNQQEDVDGYFYQDLPLPIGTINDTYDHPRTIYLEFPKYYDLKSLFFQNVDLYGSIPAQIGRLTNLDSFTIRGPAGIPFRHLNSVNADFQKTNSKIFILSNTGIKLKKPIPKWVLDSYKTEFFGFGAFFNFSDLTIKESRIDYFLENPDYLPNLKGFNLSQCNINGQLPNFRQNFTRGVNISFNEAITAFSPDCSTYHFSRFEIDRVYVDVASHVRAISQGQIKRYEAQRTGINEDFALPNTNNSIERIDIGRDSSYGGTLPTFLSQLTALKTLRFNPQGGRINPLITSWGTAGLPVSLEDFEICGCTNLPPQLPSWFSELTNLKTFRSGSWGTAARIDAHIDSFYDFVVANGTGITSFNLTANQFQAARPSGTYQSPPAPEGGASAMEKIWELVNTYNIVVTVANAAGDGVDIYTPQ